jgi:hypothetical protein
MSKVNFFVTAKSDQDSDPDRNALVCSLDPDQH